MLDDFLTFAVKYYFLMMAAVVLIILYIYDSWNTNNCKNHFNVTSYGYQEDNGPPTWRLKFPAATGSMQSPINLRGCHVNRVSADNAALLSFSHDFHRVPKEMKLYNNGHNVVLYATWTGGRKPSLVGGPLELDYNFLNIRFRWGPTDSDGTEHLINSEGYAMELQAAFINNVFDGEDMLQAARSGNLLMMSYLFKVTPADNPYLEPIVTALKYIQCPMGCICIEPIILSLLMPDFRRFYFTYTGSLTFPPCTEGVKWIVKPDPLIISSRQIEQFRKLYGCDGLLENNIRPVQKVGRREVCFVE